MPHSVENRVAVTYVPPRPPGWYPEPQGARYLRWWTGQTWGPQTQAFPPPPPKGALVKNLISIAGSLVGIAACVVFLMLLTGTWRPAFLYGETGAAPATSNPGVELQATCQRLVAEWAGVDLSQVSFEGEVGTNPNSTAVDLHGRYPDNPNGVGGEWICAATRGDSTPHQVVVHPVDYDAGYDLLVPIVIHQE